MGAFDRLPSLDKIKKDKLSEFAELLRKKNEIVNLISRKDMEDVEYRHVAFCAAISEFFKPNANAQIADVGTGGGLPGIAMAIIYPQAKIHMFDGVGRKIAAVQDMIKALGLKNAFAYNQRLEEQKFRFDYAVGRSVCALPLFFSFVHKKLNEGKCGNLSNGVIYFKGGALEPEFEQKGIVPDASLDLQKLFGDDRFLDKRLIHFSLPQIKALLA